jgi:hypothetical protein
MLALLVVSRAAPFQQAGPSIHIESIDSGRSVAIESADSEGLDWLEVSCPQADSTYHSQLSAARELKRSFDLADLFPDLRDFRKPIEITATVRNTRGAKASANISIQRK